jgi:probable phosphoglycerate mutase
MTVKLCLVRHGRTVFGERGVLCGWSDPPLDPEGRSQAVALSEALGGRAFNGIWSSDLVRAIETARLVTGVEPTVDERLRELDLGDLDGLRFDDCASDLQAGLIAFDGFHAPGGESVTSLEKRVQAFLAELWPGDHLIVTHGGVIRLLLRTMGRDRSVGPCEVVELTLPRRGARADNG